MDLSIGSVFFAMFGLRCLAVSRASPGPPLFQRHDSSGYTTFNASASADLGEEELQPSCGRKSELGGVISRRRFWCVNSSSFKPAERQTHRRRHVLEPGRVG